VNALKRFEDIIEGMIEGSTANVLAGHLQPVEVAKKLARALDHGQTIAADKLLLPNDYTVEISPDDYAVFAPFRQSLERELVAYLRGLANERGGQFIAPPRLKIVENGRLRPRRVYVIATLADPGQDQVQATNPSVEFTAPLPVSEVRTALRSNACLVLSDDRAIALDKPVISLGRSLDNDIVLDDGRVSRHHAQIRLLHNRFCLYDLDSANGTTVNGQPVSDVVLRDGDRISLGGVNMTFHAGWQETKRGA